MSTPYRLRVLHISDLHERADREEEPFFRIPVLTDRWEENLRDLLGTGPIDLVVFTGDIAYSGAPDEYERASEFVRRTCKTLALASERFFVVPGNHDISRTVRKDVWQALRKIAHRVDALEFSRWMAGSSRTPLGFEEGWRDLLLERESAFWSWVETGLGRPELRPSHSPHGRLGYRYSIHLSGFPFEVHVLGLDTSWLAGADDDAGNLRLTRHQLEKLGTRDGRPLAGLRLGLMHHPLSELADARECFPILAEYTDVLLRGHLHQPQQLTISDPDRHLREFPAGSLFDSASGIHYRNGCQLITFALDESGRLEEEPDVQFRSWSPNGRFWHDDQSIYRHHRADPLSSTLPTLARSRSAAVPEDNQQNESEPSAPYQRLSAGLTRMATHLERFLDEYLGTSTKPSAFGGRQREMLLLNEWLTTTASRQALLIEHAGRGKSALLARWCHRVATEGSATVIFVPVSIRFSTAMLLDALRLLGERLRYLDGVSTAHPSDPDEWRAEIDRALRRDRNSPTVIVFDGLDEAVDWELGKEFMLPPLGRNVKILVSARPVGARDAEGWRRQVGFEANALRLKLPALSEAEVHEALRSIAGAEFAADQNVLSQLHRLSGGDPLLVRLYLDAISDQGGRDTIITREKLHELQPGLEDLFETWFQQEDERWQQKSTAGLRVVMEELLGICATALGPLSQEDLSTVAEGPLRQPAMLRRALVVAGRFIIGDGNRQGFVFSHPRLRDFWFDKMLAPHDRTKWEQRFLALGRETLLALPEPTMGRRVPSEYVLRFYGAHLQRAKASPERFYDLLSLTWADAWERLDETFSGFLMDVDRAWNIAEREIGKDASHIVPLVKCALLQATIASLHDMHPKVIERLVERQVWSLERAASRARRMPFARERAKSLGAIARFLPEPARRQMYLEAFNHALSLDIGQRKQVFEALAPHLPESLLVEALALTHVQFGEIVRAQLIADVLDMLPVITPECANYLLDTIKNWETASAKTLVHCALLRNNLSEPRQALELALRENDLNLRVSALASLVKTTNDATIIQEACELLLSLADAQDLFEEERGLALEALAESAPESFSSVVLERVQHLQYPRQRCTVLCELAHNASAPIQHEHLIKEAITSAGELTHAFHRAEVYLELLCVCQLPALRESLRGLLLADFENLPDSATRVEILASLIKELKQSKFSDEIAEGARLLNEAVESARQAVPLVLRVEAFSWLLPMLVGEQHDSIRDEGFALLFLIEDGKDARFAASYLVDHLSDAQLNQLPTVLRRIGDAVERVTAIVNCCEELDKDARLSAAAFCGTWIRQMSDAKRRTEGLCWLSYIAPSTELDQILREAFSSLKKMEADRFDEEPVWLVERCGETHRWDLAFEVMELLSEGEEEDVEILRSGAIFSLIGSAETSQLLQLEKCCHELTPYHRDNLLAEIVGRYAQLRCAGDARRVMASMAHGHAKALALIAIALPAGSVERSLAENEARTAIQQLPRAEERMIALAAATPFLTAQEVLEACELAGELNKSPEEVIFSVTKQAERLLEFGMVDDALNLMNTSMISSDRADIAMSIAWSTGDWLKNGPYAEAALELLSDTHWALNALDLGTDLKLLKSLPPTVASRILRRIIRAQAPHGRSTLLEVIGVCAPLISAIGGQHALKGVVEAIKEVCSGRE